VLNDTECLRGANLSQTAFLGHELPPHQIDAPRPVPKMATAGEKAEIDQLSTFQKNSLTSFRFFFAILGANEAGQKNRGCAITRNPGDFQLCGLLIAPGISRRA
jgi:hypothetical protein